MKIITDKQILLYGTSFPLHQVYPFNSLCLLAQTSFSSKKFTTSFNLHELLSFLSDIFQLTEVTTKYDVVYI